jgi:hypothetical protein
MGSPAVEDLTHLRHSSSGLDSRVHPTFRQPLTAHILSPTVRHGSQDALSIVSNSSLAPPKAQRGVSWLLRGLISRSHQLSRLFAAECAQRWLRSLDTDLY